jgi:TfoX/Sxy family transcriptional regulator of competence genes
MPYNEKLADRVREAFADLPVVEEKKIFRGVCFMVDNKMCVCISGDELLCRVGSEIFEENIEKEGCRAMMRNSKPYKDFLFVSEDNVKTKAGFDYWIKQSLAFNPLAKASKKKNR